MTTFRVQVDGSTETRTFEKVESFVGEDNSGSFGILAGHARFMTQLVFGLARFKLQDEGWRYLATTGGIAYFMNDTLRVSTRRFLVDPDFESISAALAHQLAVEEAEVKKLRESLHQIEESMLHRLLSLRRGGEGGL